MELSKETKEVILSKLQEKTKPECILCHEGGYVVSDTVFIIPTEGDGCATLVARCPNCGHTIFIDPYNLGVMDLIINDFKE